MRRALSTVLKAGSHQRCSTIVPWSSFSRTFATNSRTFGAVTDIFQRTVLVQSHIQGVAPGHQVTFGNGSEGLVLWHISPARYVVYLKPGSADVEVGEASTVGDGVSFNVADCIGQTVDYLGTPKTTDASTAAFDGSGLPTEQQLFFDYPSTDVRQNLRKNLHTGLRAMDMLTPVARGQTMLLHGRYGSGASEALVDILHSQTGSDVKCVYVKTGHAPSKASGQLDTILASKHTVGTTVVWSPFTAYEDEPQGFLALHTGIAIGAALRDAGHDALVLCDDLYPLGDMWRTCWNLYPTLVESEQNIDVQGMQIQLGAAERRKIYSTAMQQSAQLMDSQGGGSLSIIASLEGEPADLAHTSFDDKMPSDLRKEWGHLGADKLQKLMDHLIERKLRQATIQTHRYTGPQMVEEMRSLLDGHVSLLGAKLPPNSMKEQLPLSYDMDFKDSMSRIGGAFSQHPAFWSLAPRLKLALIGLQQQLANGMVGSYQHGISAAQGEQFLAVLNKQLPGAPSSSSELLVATLSILTHCCPPSARTNPQAVLNAAQRFVQANTEAVAAVQKAASSGSRSDLSEALDGLKELVKDHFEDMVAVEEAASESITSE